MDRPPNLPPRHMLNHPPSQPPNPNTSFHHRPLLPAPPHSEPSRGASSPSANLIATIPTIPKRQSASSACDLCRTKKTKCDNQRPSCRRCLQVNVPCVYDADVNETSNQALKRKYNVARNESKDLRELFECLRQRPPDEANEILARIRNSDDPVQVLQSVREAALILPSDFPQSPRRDTLSLDQRPDAHLIPIQVPAQPWTGVASNTVISNLVWQFFSHDNKYLLPVVDQDAFIKDMCAESPARAQHCSALLVNSICAMGCLHSPQCRNLIPLFFSESNRHLALEQGRASLSSSIALYLLYLVSACLGRDRAGLHFRTWSLEMLKRLGLEKKYLKLREGVSGEEKDRDLISRVLWGLFVIDT